MNKQFDKMMNSAKKQSLTKEERSVIRGRIIEVINKYPVTNESLLSPWTHYFNLHSKVISAAFLLFFVFTSSVVAEQTIPGDLLYGVKTGVNERVLGWFAGSEDSRKEWKLALADRRLNEMQDLYSENRLSPEIKADLEQKININSEFIFQGNVSTENKKEVGLMAKSSIVEQGDARASEGSMSMTAMMATQPVENEGLLMKKSGNKVDFTEIDKLKKDLNIIKDGLHKNKSNLRNKSIFLKVKFQIIKTERALFNVKEALEANRIDEAEPYYDEVKTTLGCFGKTDNNVSIDQYVNFAYCGKDKDSINSTNEIKGEVDVSSGKKSEEKKLDNKDIDTPNLESSIDALKPSEVKDIIPGVRGASIEIN